MNVILSCENIVKTYKTSDLFYALNDISMQIYERIVGNDVDNKIYKLLDFSENPRDIADPWYTEDFEITYNDIVEGCNGFLKYLKKNNYIK